MITINLEKAKGITHSLRRKARSAEFAPLDIKATIPVEAEAAEIARQEIRDRYSDLQDQVEAAEDPETLKPIKADLEAILTTAQQGA